MCLFKKFIFLSSSKYNIFVRYAAYQELKHNLHNFTTDYKAEFKFFGYLIFREYKQYLKESVTFPWKHKIQTGL